MPDGGCGDVHDVNVAYLWVACTRMTPQGPRGVVKALSVYDGSLVGEVDVGLTATVSGQPACTVQKRSIARAVRTDPATGVVYVVGEAWCGTGPRTAFLAGLTTEATTVLWEKRIFADPGTSSSAAYALAVDQSITVAGSRTLANASAPTAHVAQFLKTGDSTGRGLDVATPGPSAAYAVSAEPSGTTLYVGATREGASSGPQGVVIAFTAVLTKRWEQSLDGAQVYGVAALTDGVVTAGGTRRFLPFWPVTDPLGTLVGQPAPGPPRGFMMRFDTDGTLRWTRYLQGGPVVGIGLQGEREQGETVFVHVVGAGYVESFRVK
jgi:hypothetical protein